MSKKLLSERAVVMQDVADKAGVSRTSVSLVLNNVPGAAIPEETRQRILDAVKTLGYRPNSAARNMRTRRTNLIGLVADQIATTPYAGQIIKGAQDAAWKRGKVLLIVNIDDEPGLEHAAMEMLLERQVEGIIYATMFHRLASPYPSIHETHAVLLDCFSSDPSFSSVVPDEVCGGYAATRLLFEHGHRKIGFINNIDDIPATQLRMAGYRQALAEAGLPFDEALVRCDHSDNKGGYRAALDLFSQVDRPTALFCFNDRMAMGAYDALRRLNLRIPQDVAVVGFDNQELIADSLYPGLTTLQLPHYEMGEWAVNQLLKQIEHPEEDVPFQAKIECRVVRRESV